MLTVVSYVRVSSQDQKCDLQRMEIKTFADRHGWVVAREYHDHAISGAKNSRPGLDALMSAALQRQFDCLLVYKIDRLGRSVAQVVNNIQKLDQHGVRFIAVSQGLDTNQASPTSRLLLHILCAVAEFERELIRERVNAGIANAKKHGTRSGNRIGRPFRVVDREGLRSERAGGASFPDLAKRYGVSLRTAQRICQAE